MLGDLGLGSGVRIPEHRQVIASGRQLALTAGSGALQGRMVALQVSMLRQKGLQCSEASHESKHGVMKAFQKLSDAWRVCALRCMQSSAFWKGASSIAGGRVVMANGLETYAARC